MTSLAITDVPWISKRIKACCRRAKLFSTDEILITQPQQLQQLLRISPQDAELLFLQVSTACAPPPVSVLDALNGELPSAHLNDALSDVIDGNDADSTGSSDSSDLEREPAEDARLSASSIVPPTQGYDGNFPGAERFVYDSDTDSDSEASAAPSDDLMRDDVELPSTSHRPQLPHRNERAVDEDVPDAGQDASQVCVARDVLSLGRECHLLSSGSQHLDELLHGGFRSAVLTEIVGESASGKTQMAIYACTFAALGFSPLPPPEEHDSRRPPMVNPHLGNDSAALNELLQGCGMAAADGSNSAVGACYITSAGERGAHAVVTRALELTDFAVRERFERVHPLLHAESSQSSLDRHALLEKALELGRELVLRNLHVACVADVEALEHALKYSLPGLMSRLSSSQRRRNAAEAPAKEIGIIVVDNLPSLFQEDPVASDIDSLVQRSKMLVEVTDALKRLAAAPSRPRSGSRLVGRAVLVINHVSDAFGLDKDIARRFVFDSADRIRLQRSTDRRGGPKQSEQAIPSESTLPDAPIAMDYATQSAFFSGLLASVPPTLAEAIGARALEEARGSNDGPLYVLNPRTAQLGHTWSNLVNVRLFLSKTRGRVAMPNEATGAPAVALGEEAKKRTMMTTVRKAAVLVNPFGPTMLDPSGVGSESTRESFAGTRAVRQLRFIITPGRAVHALNSYIASSSNAAPRLTTSQTPAAGALLATQTGSQVEPVVDEEDLFGEALEEHHWLAMDQFQSQVIERLSPA